MILVWQKYDSDSPKLLSQQPVCHQSMSNTKYTSVIPAVMVWENPAFLIQLLDFCLPSTFLVRIVFQCYFIHKNTLNSISLYCSDGVLQFLLGLRGNPNITSSLWTIEDIYIQKVRESNKKLKCWHTTLVLSHSRQKIPFSLFEWNFHPCLYYQTFSAKYLHYLLLLSSLCSKVLYWRNNTIVLSKLFFITHG